MRLCGMDPVDVVADHRRVVRETGRLLRMVGSYIRLCRLNGFARWHRRYRISGTTTL